MSSIDTFGDLEVGGIYILSSYQFSDNNSPLEGLIEVKVYKKYNKVVFVQIGVGKAIWVKSSWKVKVVEKLEGNGKS